MVGMVDTVGMVVVATDMMVGMVVVATGMVVDMVVVAMVVVDMVVVTEEEVIIAGVTTITGIAKPLKLTTPIPHRPTTKTHSF